MEAMSWQDHVRRVVPYVAGEQPGDPDIIKLNTNECPYPPAPGVAEALRQASENAARLRLYPDMDASSLVRALADRYGVLPEQIFVGVGSDDVLSMSFLSFFTEGAGDSRPLLFPDITYSFYDVWAQLYRIPYRCVPLKEDFTIDPEDYIAQPCRGIIFPNPNAPTGAQLPQEDVERIVASHPDGIVIVDEAYVDFGAASALPLLEKYDNLLVVQTFSKSRAMAGARIGFAIGNPELIGYLKDVKFSFNSYTMSLPAILAGTAAVKDERYFDEMTGRIIRTRERFKKQLKDLGFEFPDSEANFVFVRYPGLSGQALFDALRKKKILVRHWNKPRIEDYLRITIGTEEQMDTVAAALREIVG